MRGALFAFLLFLTMALSAQQVCTTPGQNPSTAFPVCGTSTFSQASVPTCGGRKMPFKSCGNDLLTDINPFWYKFTCFQSGTLGFLISPLDQTEDYDWELYDITNHNPDDVYTDANLVIANNWSGESGNTGASSSGSQLFVCGGYGKPLFSQRPQLVAGHNYLLLVSHFTNSQSGYKLSFGGGTAVITDSTQPHLQKVEASCGGDVLHLKLNKKMKCSSIAADGSDFYLVPAATTVKKSTGINCSQQFDTDSIELQLTNFLQPGNYTLHIKKGSDTNTVLDYCDRAIAETETLNFTILPKQPTPMDSMAALSCAPKEIHLLFKRPILCSSVAANGSDFTVNGIYPVAVTAAAGTCTNGSTKEVVVTLSQAMQKAGNFQITLNKGSDGNTLLDECSEETPVGSAIAFSVKDTVNADFTYNIHYGCSKDTIAFFHDGANGVNQWNWNLDEGQQSSLQNPEGLYSVFNQKKISLFVSNGFCRDSTEQTVTLDNYLKADFSVFEDNCPNEAVPFTSNAEGKIVSYLWDFGDGGTATDKDPTHIYASPDRQTTYPVHYTVTDSYGCQQTATRNVSIYPSCYLAVPTAFTPNGDGKNDVFRVLNAIKAENLELLVFNRWGQLVFKTNDWKKGWDGNINGAPQPTGVYVWFLRYTNRETQKKVEQKGTVALIR
jgi:gliding motility-associated-like protein